MSNKAVEELENILCHNAKDYLIHEWIDKCFLDKSPKFLSYFFRKCSEQFLAYQDGKCSSIIHGLVKSHMSSSNKIKSLKMLLIRGVNCNKLDGNKKSILDHLVEDNDWECIKILLDYGQNLMVSENCLCRVFKLRNKHEEIFRALFAYAIKHKVAPNRTGISDGDTFLHEIMVHEKEIAHFKKWMGFFLSFPEININALNNDGLTIFDLLLLSYKKKKFKCAIKLLIKYNIDCIQPQLFSFKSQIKKEICNYISKQDFFSISVLKNENLELNTSNTELSIISSGKGFSHNYLKLNQIPLWSSTNSSQTLKKSLNDSVNLVNIPNYEETEITFEVEIFDKIPQRSKPKQTHLPKLAKAKKYLSSKEAIVLIKEDNHKALPCQSKMTAESNKGGYMEETKTDSVSNSTSTQQLLQELSANERTVSIYKLKHKLLHHYRKLGQGSYGTSNDTNHDGNPCVFPVTAGTKKSSKEIFGLLLTSLNHSTKEQFLGINYCRNTPPLPMETKQLNRYKCHKVNFSLTPYPLQNKILINIANKLNNLKFLKIVGEIGDCASLGWAHGNLGNAMLGLDQKEKALDHLITAFHMSARYEGNPLAVGRAVSNLGNAYQAMGCLSKAKKHYEIVPGHAIYGNDLQGQGRACGNIGNIYMLLKEPVKAVHYYRETLRLSTDKNTKITGYHNRGCARFDVAECIIQGKKPKELVPATVPGSEYGRLAIKLTDEVITTDPVQETKPNRETSAQSISEQNESSLPFKMLPVIIKGKSYDGISGVEVVRTAEALPFYEAAQHDLLEAIESHEQGVQNVKGSHEALNLSLSLFESNSRSFYKIQETLVELGKLCQRLSRLGLMDMAATDPQEFKDALVYGEQARARTLGELVLQKKKTKHSDLFSISTPLTIQDIYKTVKLQKMPVVFLSYCVSKLLMWILVEKNDEVVMRCQSVELKEEDLENGSFELYIRYNLLQFLSKDEIYIFRRCAYEQESPFTVLHDVIAMKIIEGLRSVRFSEVKEFIVIPDSITHLLPFSPLMNKHNWQFFGDKYCIRIIPSFLSLLVMSMTSNPVVEIPGDKTDFLIVGNPLIPPFMYDSTQWNLGRLPYAEKEAISVANIIGTIPVLREQATKQSVLYRLRSAKVIHLATHGSASGGFLAFTSSFPISKSGVAEKEHILIFPKEIETLNISPALVVLSSCDSARGQVKAEGVIGMARAFLSAGAHSVLVSLWRVPDESANVFMNFFYQFLVNGLPSLQALQRSMQCLRCFLKYSHYVHWSGFQIIGKEVLFHKDSSAQFPIQKLLGEVSIFPRQHVENIKESLLGVKNKIFTDVQLLVGILGNEPEECARDFIKNCYYYYPCGVYWYDATNELLLETSMKIAHETPLVGAVHKEQKELDPLPTVSNPSLLTTKGDKSTSRKEKKLIVLHNFTSLKNCHFIMREMKDASADIIVVSNELFCKEEMAQEFDKYLNRGCNIIKVSNLQPISILQRIVYGLLEKNSFVARDADHIVFTLLSEYSRGAATVVHMLTSLMQKSDDNSRTGFELVKQQLKLHIAHLKLEKFSNTYSMQNLLTEAKSIAYFTLHCAETLTTDREPQIDDYGYMSVPRGLEQSDEMFELSVSKSEEESEFPMDILPKGYVKSSPIIQEGYTSKPSNMSTKAKELKESLALKSQSADDRHTMISSSEAVSNPEHIISSDPTQPLPTAKPGKENFLSTEKNPLYLYISDILSTTSNISLPAHHLLNCLAITGPIPLPLFYVEELDNVIMNAVFNKEKKRIQAESPMKQLIKEGIIRRSCYPILYHKDLDTDYIDLSIQQMTVPKLICDAVKDEMDDIDKVLAVLSVQHALENLIKKEMELHLLHLQYLLIIADQLQGVYQELDEFSDELIVTNQKLKLRIALITINKQLANQLN